MPSWTVIALISTFLSSIGVIIDKWLLKSHKTKIHSKVIEMWCELNETNTPNLPKLMAEYSILLINRIWNGRRKVVVILLYFLYYFIVLMFGKYFTVNTYEEVGFWKSFAYFLDDISHSRNSLHFIILMLINLGLDLLTLYITLKILKSIFTAEKVKAILFISLDIIAAIMLAYIAAMFGTLIGDPFLVGSEPPGVFTPLMFFLDFFPEMFDGGRRIPLFGVIWLTASNIMMAVTTFVPTVIYFVVMLMMYLGKVVLFLSKKIVEYFFERIADDEPNKIQPFTLTGTLFSLIALLIKTVDSFIK